MDNSVLEVYNLFSGSRGNCTFLRCGNDGILIDAGLSALAVSRALATVGASLDDIKAIFVTHEHTDHVSALSVICKKHRIPIHIAEMSARYLKADPCVFDQTVTHRPGDTVRAGCFEVTSFEVPHDSAMCLGYRIDSPDGSCGTLTDLGQLKRSTADILIGCRGIILESNHDVDMLTGGPYPETLKSRILSSHGHLSNRDCARGAAYFAAHGTRSFLLAHLSEQNNLPSLAFDTVNKRLESEYAGMYTLNVAGPKSVTPLFSSRVSGHEPC